MTTSPVVTRRRRSPSCRPPTSTATSGSPASTSRRHLLRRDRIGGGQHLLVDGLPAARSRAARLPGPHRAVIRRDPSHEREAILVGRRCERLEAVTPRRDCGGHCAPETVAPGGAVISETVPPRAVIPGGCRQGRYAGGGRGTGSTVPRPSDAPLPDGHCDIVGIDAPPADTRRGRHANPLPLTRAQRGLLETAGTATRLGRDWALPFRPRLSLDRDPQALTIAIPRKIPATRPAEPATIVDQVPA